jgi:hypothetical protein
MQSPRVSINIGSYYRIDADTYQQRSINNGPKIISNDILEPLLMISSVVVSCVNNLMGMLGLEVMDK